MLSCCARARPGHRSTIRCQINIQPAFRAWKRAERVNTSNMQHQSHVTAGPSLATKPRQAEAQHTLFMRANIRPPGGQACCEIRAVRQPSNSSTHQVRPGPLLKAAMSAASLQQARTQRDSDRCFAQRTHQYAPRNPALQHGWASDLEGRAREGGKLGSQHASAHLALPARPAEDQHAAPPGQRFGHQGRQPVLVPGTALG